MPALGRVRSVLAEPTPTDGVEMDHYELGVALAVAHLAELHRQADRRRLASRSPGPHRTSVRGQAARAATGPQATRPDR